MLKKCANENIPDSFMDVTTTTSGVFSSSGYESNIPRLSIDTPRSSSHINLSDQKEQVIEQINVKTAAMLEFCDMTLKNIMSTAPVDFLKEEVDLQKSGDFIKLMKETFGLASVESPDKEFAFASTTINTVKKRARSSNNNNKKENDADSTTKSISPPSSAFKVRRVMKTNEEALSRYGSPLFVQTTIIEAPRVIIPLEGGNVLNIEPKKAKRRTQVPVLSLKTRKQLQILRENIDKCLTYSLDN